MLSHYVSSHQKDSDVFLPYVCWAMNTSRSETTGYAPFQLVYGRDPVQPLDFAIDYNVGEEVQDPAKYMAYIRDWLTSAREVAVEKVNRTYIKEANRYNSKRKPVEFDVGDLVLECYACYKTRTGGEGSL